MQVKQTVSKQSSEGVIRITEQVGGKSQYMQRTHWYFYPTYWLQTSHPHSDSAYSEAFIQSTPISKIMRLQRLGLERHFHVWHVSEFVSFTVNAQRELLKFSVCQIRTKMSSALKAFLTMLCYTWHISWKMAFLKQQAVTSCLSACIGQQYQT